MDIATSRIVLRPETPNFIADFEHSIALDVAPRPEKLLRNVVAAGLEFGSGAAGAVLLVAQLRASVLLPPLLDFFMALDGVASPGDPGVRLHHLVLFPLSDSVSLRSRLVYRFVIGGSLVFSNASIVAFPTLEQLFLLFAIGMHHSSMQVVLSLAGQVSLIARPAFDTPALVLLDQT